METNILPTHRIVWTLLCVYPVDEKVSKWKKWAVSLFPLISFAAHISLIASSIAYILEFVWIDLESCLIAFGQFVAFSPIVFVLPIAFLCRHKIVIVFEKLAEIHNKCEYTWNLFFFHKMMEVIKCFCFFSLFIIYFTKPDQTMDSYEYLVRANETSEWLWQFYFKFMLCGVSSTIVLMTFSIYMCWLRYGTFDATYLYHPFKVMLVTQSDNFRSKR